MGRNGCIAGGEKGDSGIGNAVDMCIYGVLFVERLVKKKDELRDKDCRRSTSY